MKRQKGLALLVAMIVLVVMSIAGISLVRTVDTGILVAGNLAFRQGATQAADIAVEEARAWLLHPTASLEQNVEAQGYYATNQNTLDLTGNASGGASVVYNAQVAWPGITLNANMTAIAPKCSVTADLTQKTGNSYCYVIHRLCDGTGALSGGTCSTKAGTRGGSSLGGNRQMLSYQQGAWASATAYGYYRVTVRVAGPRNNVSFVQAYLII